MKGRNMVVLLATMIIAGSTTQEYLARQTAPPRYGSACDVELAIRRGELGDRFADMAIKGESPRIRDISIPYKIFAFDNGHGSIHTVLALPDKLVLLSAGSEDTARDFEMGIQNGKQVLCYRYTLGSLPRESEGRYVIGEDKPTSWIIRDDDIYRPSGQVNRRDLSEMSVSNCTTPNPPGGAQVTEEPRYNSVGDVELGLMRGDLNERLADVVGRGENLPIEDISIPGKIFAVDDGTSSGYTVLAIEDRLVLLCSGFGGGYARDFAVKNEDGKQVLMYKFNVGSGFLTEFTGQYVIGDDEPTTWKSPNSD